MKIGGNLKKILKDREIKLTQLQEMSGVAYDDIRNILNDRSRNAEKVGLILKALNIPMEAITSPGLEKQEINIAIYYKAVSSLNKALGERNPFLNKTTLDELIAKLYIYVTQHPDESEEKLTGFAEGIIHSNSSIIAEMNKNRQ